MAVAVPLVIWRSNVPLFLKEGRKVKEGKKAILGRKVEEGRKVWEGRFRKECLGRNV
jgi:hypothetical protein